MTTRHKIRLIPARIRWFFQDIKGAVLYYRRYKDLKIFVLKLEEEYLSEEKKRESDSVELLEYRVRYEMARNILKGKHVW